MTVLLAVAESAVVPPEPTVEGVAVASTVRGWLADWTVRVVLLVSLSASAPLDKPVTERVTVRSLSVLLAAAV